jgi:hypothetical protein
MLEPLFSRFIHPLIDMAQALPLELWLGVMALGGLGVGIGLAWPKKLSPNTVQDDATSRRNYRPTPCKMTQRLAATA